MSLHGPELAVSTIGRVASSAEGAIRFVQQLGVRAAALDVSAPGFRPRDLSRSDRRGLASTLRRAELELASIDLFVPPEHFEDPTNASRAVEALTAAIGLAAELPALIGGRSRTLVSTQLGSGCPEGVRDELDAYADRRGVVLADHTPGVDPRGSSSRTVCGVDPAASIFADEDPGARALISDAHRLSDVNAQGRCAVGAEAARLDLVAYAGACAVSGARFLIIDLRGVHDPAAGTRRAMSAWNTATL